MTWNGWETGLPDPGVWVVLADETLSLAELRPTAGPLGVSPGRSVSHAIWVACPRPTNLPTSSGHEIRFVDADLDLSGDERADVGGDWLDPGKAHPWPKSSDKDGSGDGVALS
ncbi:hypothetical protein [Streptomyces xylophagus]|uniref:hypothetical protein n=1 Tax=Streptomyces xylophagus TaxID=285514 RepID=UPI00131B6DB3|nr:hypothetical protein [Streptomyces xylophagus]